MHTYARPIILPQHVQDELGDYSPYLRQLLFTRGIATKSDAEAFLHPSYDDHLHDPFLLHDMDKAVARIFAAIAGGEHIVIYSDYDCDGIPGAVVLHDFFKAINYEHFSNYIPHRHYEGFGLNAAAVDTLGEKGVKLIITVDCGTSDHGAVLRAGEFGVDVIITDHHEPKEELPSAYAIVNPKVGESYPFSGLCGSGVVYKLVQALIIRNETAGAFTLKSGWEKWWLDMVALATIADMVPLLGENRALAYYGLQVLRKSRRPGLQQLVRKQRASMHHLTEDDIGFTIGPRINAASRMDTPEQAFHMLSCQDEGEAGAFVDHLEHLNNERRGIVAAMHKEVNKRIEMQEVMPDVIVIGNPDWRPSLVGLLANKLSEEYKRPAFLWGRDGNGMIRGSCRSDGFTSVVNLMNEIPHLFTEHGGHHFSGGFSVFDEHIHSLPAALNEVFARLGEGARFDSPLQIDAELALEAVDRAFIAEQSLLAPFGEGNPKPLYLFKKITPERIDIFGKAKEHLKLIFDTQGSAKEAIGFFMAPDHFGEALVPGKAIDLYAHVEQSYFMGRLQTRLRIIDIV